MTLFSTCIVLFVALILSFTVLPLVKIAWMKKRLAKTGIEADAELISIQKTKVYVSKRPQVRLQLRVKAITGIFTAEAKDVLWHTDIHEFQPGSLLKVKYNPDNYAEVMLLHP